MTPIALHPDELLDRTRRGERITDDERVRVEQHLAACADCRLEQRAASDFTGFRVNPAMDAMFARTVAKTLERAALRGAAARPTGPRVRWLRGMSLAAAIPLGVALAASVVVAAVMGARLLREQAVEQVDTPGPQAPSTLHAAPAVRGRAPARVEPSATVLPEVVGPLPSLAPPVAVTPSAGRPAPVDAGTAASLFEQATAARRSGDFVRAAVLFRRLERRFSDSREAVTSHVLLGRILGEHLGDAAGALVECQTYARSGATELREEALVCVASSLGRLGRATDEKVAWEALLTAYPDGVQVERARRRIGDLE